MKSSLITALLCCAVVLSTATTLGEITTTHPLSNADGTVTLVFDEGTNPQVAYDSTPVIANMIQEEIVQDELDQLVPETAPEFELEKDVLESPFVENQEVIVENAELATPGYIEPQTHGLVGNEGDCTHNMNHKGQVMVGDNAEVPAGIQLGVASSSIEKVLNHVIPKIFDKLKSQTFPGISGKKKGTKFRVWDIRVVKTGFSKAKSTVSGKGLGIHINGLHLEIHGRFKFRKFIIGGKGKFTIKFTAGDIGCDVKINKVETPQGPRTEVVATSVDVKLSQFKIKFKGGIFGFLANIVMHFVKNKIKKGVEGGLKKALAAAIKGISAAMLKRDNLIPIGKWGVMNTAMTRNAEYFTSTQRIMVSHDAEIYPVPHRKPDGAVAKRVMQYTPSTRDVDFNLNEFVLNSVFHAWRALDKVNEAMNGETELHSLMSESQIAHVTMSRNQQGGLMSNKKKETGKGKEGGKKEKKGDKGKKKGKKDKGGKKGDKEQEKEKEHEKEKEKEKEPDDDIDADKSTEKQWVRQIGGVLTESTKPQDLTTKLSSGTLATMLASSQASLEAAHHIDGRFGDLPIKVEVIHTRDPLVTFKPNNASFSIFVDLKVSVVNSVNATSPVDNGKAFKLFTIATSLTGSLNLGIEHVNDTNRLLPKLLSTSATARVTDSAIGDFDANSIAQLLTGVINTFILPQINDKIKQSHGFPLPMPHGLTMLNTGLRVNDGFLHFESDIAFRPTPRLSCYLNGLSFNREFDLVEPKC